MRFPEIIAIIPASGKGERFGKPKAEAVYEGKSFVEHITATLKEAGIEDIFIAEGFGTPDMLSTLRMAVQKLAPKQAMGYLIFPVDHPFITAETVISLCSEFMQAPDAVLRPSYLGKIGHPVIIPAWLDLTGDDHNEGLAGIIRSQACTVIDLPVPDGKVLRNVNYPKDMEL